MKTILKLSAGVLMLSLVACGASENDTISKKKEELTKAKSEQQALSTTVDQLYLTRSGKLEDELSKLDSSFAKPEKAKAGSHRSRFFRPLYTLYRSEGKDRCGEHRLCNAPWFRRTGKSTLR